MNGRDERPARERFLGLPDGAGREAWTEALHEAIAETYLAEDADAYQGSGRSSGASGWETKRGCIADAVHQGGDFLDVGCANGLLLESLVEWCTARGHRIRPHGIDFCWDLIARARRRHPAFETNFEVANAFWWAPARRYDFVRTNVEYVRGADLEASVRRLFDTAVAPGGRLILCHYASPGEPIDVAGFLESLNLTPKGTASAPNVAVAWTDRAGS